MKIIDYFSELKNKECWSVIAGPGSGSVFSLGFGNKKPRKYPLRNQTLSSDERLFEAEFGILVYCAWRLSRFGIIECGWRDSNEAGGKMQSGLHSLKGKNIQKTDIGSISSDLTIHFSEGFLLQIFCDITNDFESDFNYTIHHNGESLGIGVCGELDDR